jgi:dihydroorotate dehydrogenase
MKDDLLDEVPVIAYGGASSGEDMAKFILAGATAVGLGTTIYQSDVDVFSKATEELEAWMVEKGYDSIHAFRGKALDWLESPGAPEFGETELEAGLENINTGATEGE